jgi:hypothetical protein
MPLTLALEGLRQGYHEFEASLGFIVRPCLKTKQNRTKQNKIRRMIEGVT